MALHPKTVMCMPVSSSFAKRAVSLAENVAYKEELEKRPLEELASRSAVHGTHRCCAERRLLQSYQRLARKAGVPPHKQVAWVRRKLGTNVAVWRFTTDGELGCATPCLFCNRELQRFDLRVHCSTDAAGGWFSGRLCEPGAPRPQLTGGQQKVLRQQGWQMCSQPQAPKPRQQAPPKPRSKPRSRQARS